MPSVISPWKVLSRGLSSTGWCLFQINILCVYTVCTVSKSKIAISPGKYLQMFYPGSGGGGGDCHFVFRWQFQNCNLTSYRWGSHIHCKPKSVSAGFCSLLKDFLKSIKRRVLWDGSPLFLLNSLIDWGGKSVVCPKYTLAFQIELDTIHNL